MRPIHQFTAFVVITTVAFMCVAAALIYVCEHLRAEHRLREWGLYIITTALGYAYTRTMVDEIALRVLKATSNVFRAMTYAVQVDTAFMLVDFASWFFWFPFGMYIVVRVIQLGTTAFIAEYAACIVATGLATTFDRVLHIKANFTMQRFLHHFAVAAWLCAALEWSPERDAAMLMLAMIDVTGKVKFGFFFLGKMARQHAKMVHSQLKSGDFSLSGSTSFALPTELSGGSSMMLSAHPVAVEANPSTVVPMDPSSLTNCGEPNTETIEASPAYALSRAPSVRRVLSVNDSIDPYLLYSAETSALLGKLAFVYYVCIGFGGSVVLLIVYLSLWWDQIPIAFRVVSIVMAVAFGYLDREYIATLRQRSRVKYWTDEIFASPVTPHR